MTAAARKSTRTKKTVPLDLTNPKSQLAKCADIKGLVKGKIENLSKDAQMELMALLPECDQNYDDLKTALDNNPIFWTSLEEWHDLLAAGELKLPKRQLSARDLEEIPYKDDNFERYWGEKLEKSQKEEAKQDKRQQPSSRRSRPSPKRKSAKTTTPPAKTTTSTPPKKGKRTADGVKTETRGRKKKTPAPPALPTTPVPLAPSAPSASPSKPVESPIDIIPLDNNNDDVALTVDDIGTTNADKSEGGDAQQVEELKPAVNAEPVDAAKLATTTAYDVSPADDGKSENETKPMELNEKQTNNGDNTLTIEPSNNGDNDNNTSTMATTTTTPSKVSGPTIPIHPPPKSKNKARSSTSTRTTVQIPDRILISSKSKLPPPSDSTMRILHNDDDDFEDGPISKPSPKRPRTKRRSTKTTDDDIQSNDDGDNDDMDYPAPKRQTRSRTNSNN